MIDLFSAALGAFVGVCVGVVFGTIRTAKVIDELEEEMEKL